MEVHGGEAWTVVSVDVRSVYLILEARIVGLVAGLAVVAVYCFDDAWAGESAPAIDLVVISARMDF